MTIRDKLLIFYTLVRLFPLWFAGLALCAALLGFAIANLPANILLNYFVNFPVFGVSIIDSMLAFWLLWVGSDEKKSP
jgi:hypothetical protein